MDLLDTIKNSPAIYGQNNLVSTSSSKLQSQFTRTQTGDAYTPHARTDKHTLTHLLLRGGHQELARYLRAEQSR